MADQPVATRLYAINATAADSRTQVQDPVTTSDAVLAACAFLDASAVGVLVQLHSRGIGNWTPYQPGVLLRGVQLTAGVHEQGDPYPPVLQAVEAAQARWLLRRLDPYPQTLRKLEQDARLPPAGPPAHPSSAAIARAAQAWASLFAIPLSAGVLARVATGLAPVPGLVRQLDHEVAVTLNVLGAVGRPLTDPTAERRSIASLWQILHGIDGVAAGRATAATEWLNQRQLALHPRTAAMLQVRPDLAEPLLAQAAQHLDPRLLHTGANRVNISSAEAALQWSRFERVGRLLIGNTTPGDRAATAPEPAATDQAPLHEAADRWRQRVPAAAAAAHERQHAAATAWRASQQADNFPSLAVDPLSASSLRWTSLQADRRDAALDALARYADAQDTRTSAELHYTPPGPRPGRDRPALADYLAAAHRAQLSTTVPGSQPPRETLDILAHHARNALAQAAPPRPATLDRDQNRDLGEQAAEDIAAALQQPTHLPAPSAAPTSDPQPWDAFQPVKHPDPTRPRGPAGDPDPHGTAFQVRRALAAIPAVVAAPPARPPAPPDTAQQSAQHARALYADRYPTAVPGPAAEAQPTPAGVTASATLQQRPGRLQPAAQQPRPHTVR